MTKPLAVPRPPNVHAESGSCSPAKIYPRCQELHLALNTATMSTAAKAWLTVSLRIENWTYSLYLPVYLYIYIYIHLCLCVCACSCMICMCNMYRSINGRARACVRACVRACMRGCVCVCVCVLLCDFKAGFVTCIRSPGLWTQKNASIH